jgi:hypothetical protein
VTGDQCSSRQSRPSEELLAVPKHPFHTSVGCILAAATLLASCAAGPKAVIDGGMRFELSSNKLPIDLALCLVRNAERTHNTLSGTHGAGETPGTTEVLIRVPEGVIAVAHISAAKPGSTGRLWIIGSVSEAAYLHAEFTRGC